MRRQSILRRQSIFPAALVAALVAACARDEQASTDSITQRAEPVVPSVAPAPPAMSDQRREAATDASASAGEEGFTASGVAANAAGAGSARPSGVGEAAMEVGKRVRPDQPLRTQGVGDSIATSMIIRTGQVTVKVDSLDVAVVRVRQLAARLGGYVANASLAGGEDQVRSATLEIKLPASRFDEAVNGLRPIGEVERADVQAQDVGEEFVDISARVTNAHRLEERMIDLLARRTGRLQDVLAVERELARVREEIERYEGRLRYLRTRAAVSTLAVTVHEPPPILVRDPGANPISEAVRDAWRNFVLLTAWAIASLGVVIPVAVVVALAWAIWRRYGPRGARRAVDAVKPAV
jgi:hypothetical protein